MGRRSFSLEFKKRAVAQVKSGQHVAQVSRQCDVATVTIKRWVKEDEEGMLIGSHPSSGRQDRNSSAFRHLQREVDDLKRLLGSKELEISRLRERMGTE